MFSSTDTLLDSQMYESRIRDVREQATLWHLERPEEYDDVSVPISTQRVCISQTLVRLYMRYTRADTQALGSLLNIGVG